MNGRVYDPKLGRFLQADPFIQAADNTQSYNRYSYVINNPLNATDPSGFFFDKIGGFLKQAAGALTAIAVTAFCQVCGAPLIGALSGAVGAAAAGGNILKGAAFGALSGAVFNGIGEAFNGTALEGGLAHIGSHALAGGTLSALQGGKFITGFASAGIAKAANVNRIMKGEIDPLARSTRIFTAAIVGGTVSEITGGKFANGATTAALAQAVNGERTQTRENRLNEQAVRFGDLHDISAEEAETLFKQARSEVLSMDEASHVSPDDIRLDNRFALINPNTDETEFFTDFQEASQARSRGFGIFGGFEKGGEITIFRTAFSADIRAINLSRQKFDDFSYGAISHGIQSGVFIIGHEIGHIRNPSEISANVFGKNALDRFRNNN